MGEYIGEVKWCNSVRMEISTDKVLHNGDGLCFLNEHDELVGIRADVVNGTTVSCNRPHGAQRNFKIYRNYDIEWQRQVEASKGNRKIDIELVLEDVPEGYRMTAASLRGALATRQSTTTLNCEKIPATNPEKALENIRRKALQWGDTIFNPVSLEIRFSQPYLIPASVLGEMKRVLLAQLEVTTSLRAERSGARQPTLDNNGLLRSARNDEPDAIPTHLMTCHHCIRYANGLCPKETGKPVGPLFIRNGANTFRLEFDCKNCLMYVSALE